MNKQQQNKSTPSGSIMLSGGYEVESKAIGTISIQESALSTIVKRTASEIEGISRLAGSSLIDSLAELVGSRKIQDRAITVTYTEQSSVSIRIAIVVFFGVKIPEIVETIRTRVSDAIEKMTGLKVSSVIVDIRDMEMPAPAADDDSDNSQNQR